MPEEYTGEIMMAGLQQPVYLNRACPVACVEELKSLRAQVMTLQKELADTKKDLDGALSKGQGFWGRACARLLQSRNSAETQLTKAEREARSLERILDHKDRLLGRAWRHRKVYRVLLRALRAQRDLARGERDAFKAQLDRVISVVVERIQCPPGRDRNQCNRNCTTCWDCFTQGSPDIKQH